MQRTIAIAAISAALTLAACDRAPDRGVPEARPSPERVPDTKVGQRVSDAAITAKVKTALLAESGVPGTAINVDTAGGNVTLRGRVDNQRQVERAVQVARGVEGVREVVNQLTVGTG